MVRGLFRIRPIKAEAEIAVGETSVQTGKTPLAQMTGAVDRTTGATAKTNSHRKMVALRNSRGALYRKMMLVGVPLLG